MEFKVIFSLFLFLFRFKRAVTLKNHIISVHERAYLAVCEICARVRNI